ncbi:D-tyrosyl-tRNA(Tyr) deacylase [Apibacter sp. B3706]|uniref:D-aminoacyl-tRNA deacylase n=1 Tax=Apibacter TaxID=1778601 RepID=UPI000CF8591F|nr:MULTISPECIES: D-aminoacyl-tRNA deacylase [Apibacter]MCX8677634.1 D-tyrosyl-tRNA(Tyr) deacylase [Apibacter sp. B3919]MXO24169.1 D-tyrosyl-tRNA(Tyr) deacylase [Apibacter sp. B3924]MXO26951.1 D-tyrosyl-tRNA(Tyr) deacylase [Apibacter sp. B3813]MXO28921.1 D-tyrosyl-tRNA(Tyr) deacylase [Apibacter sp. B3913]MXO30872.1 D-tyrosyl-tRNA(Tyr) deacylase [Apibacter sp. B3912]
MRVVIQRVLESSVKVDNKIVGQIDHGLLILLGIEEADNREDIDWLSNKICNLRIFNDENEIMNKSILDIGGDILLVSQFTLHASTKKGNRPSYIKAAKQEFANTMYEKFKDQLSNILSKPVQSGIFGADMKVSLLNDGPVTILIDSKNKE